MRTKLLPLAGLALLAGGIATSCSATDAADERLAAPRIEAVRASLVENDHVRIPEVASERLELRDHGMRLGVRWAGARPVEGARVDDARGGAASWTGALAGADVSVRWREDGFEDAIHFPERPAEELVRYELDLEGVAGLRLVDDVLELLDAGGAPRLRVSRPYVVSGASRVRAGTSIEGCAYSSDSRPPWGREVVPPGSDHCALIVRWDGESATYPATLDPIWSATTNHMVEARTGRLFRNPLVLIEGGPQDGRVYTAGGQTDGVGGSVLDSAEMFDPGTATWSTLGPLPAGPQRGLMLASVVVGGETRVLLAGGCGAVCNSTTDAWLFDPDAPAAAAYTKTGDMLTPRAVGFITRLGDGRVVVTGGGGLVAQPIPVSTDIYHPDSGTWTAGPVPSTGRVFGGSALLKDGRFLIAGGRDIAIAGALRSAELFDPLTDTWSAPFDLVIERHHFDLVVLPDGRAVAVGGETQLAYPTAIEIFDPMTNAFSSGVGEIAEGRLNPVVTLLPNGFVAVVGGSTVEANASDRVEILDPTTLEWADSEPLMPGWTAADRVRLHDGRTLVAGGSQSAIVTAATDRSILLGTYAQAVACAIDGECASGHCVDSVCCDGACDAPCSACSAATKQSGDDGTCGPVMAGSADAKCGDDSHACGNTGRCTANGACEVVAVGEPCATCDINQTGTCDVATDGARVCVCVGAHCVDDHTLETPDGPVIDCAPYLCAEDDCRHSCNTSTECVDGYLCDANHHCIFEGKPGDAPPLSTPVPEGCSCSEVGAIDSPISATALLVAIAVGLAARGRARREHGRRSQRVRAPAVPCSARRRPIR